MTYIMIIFVKKSLQATGNFQIRTFIARRVDNRSVLSILNKLLPVL